MTVKDARIAAGLTQKEAANLVGMPKRTLESWEEGARKPPEWIERLVIEKIDSIKRESV